MGIQTCTGSLNLPFCLAKAMGEVLSSVLFSQDNPGSSSLILVSSVPLNVHWDADLCRVC